MTRHDKPRYTWLKLAGSLNYIKAQSTSSALDPSHHSRRSMTEAKTRLAHSHPVLFWT
jgi:hypothetical protein